MHVALSQLAAEALDRPRLDKLEAIGLEPSDTGQPGGQRTGQLIRHVILEGGPCDRAYAEILGQGFAIF